MNSNRSSGSISVARVTSTLISGVADTPANIRNVKKIKSSFNDSGDWVGLHTSKLSTAGELLAILMQLHYK